MSNKEIDLVKSLDNADKLMSLEETLLLKKVQRLYFKETGKSHLIDEENNKFSDEYLLWGENYFNLQQNKNKKVICSNCKKIIKYVHKNKPLICPECGDKYWDKPYDEFTLFKLQEKYLNNREDNKALTEIYKISIKYAERIMVGMLRNKFHITRDDFHVKAHNAACKLILKYCESPEFFVEFSFGGFLKGPVLNELYGKQAKQNSNLSLNSIIDDDSGEFMMDFLQSISNEAKERMSVEIETEVEDRESNVVELIMKRLNKINVLIRMNQSIKESINNSIGVYHKINGKTDNFMNDYYNDTGSLCKQNIEKSMYIIYKTLKNNMN
jgi:DNA-directed RNA polymerase subunit RPC12/RpoP